MPTYVDRKEDLVYLDNRGVRITKTWLKVNTATFAIANITSYTAGEIKPRFKGPAVGAFIGLVIALAGFETGTWLAAGAGIVLFLAAIGWGVSRKPDYFLRIVSTGTESQPVYSKDKCYIDDIVDAIHKAKLQQE
jgi:hypothetical protein